MLSLSLVTSSKENGTISISLCQKKSKPRSLRHKNTISQP